MNNTTNQPLLSVCMISYNHEKFIKQALDSILMQKVNFAYEIVVGEDCSTDNTKNLLLEYNNNFPGLFKLILQKTNTGGIPNFIETLNACTGKYIAYLESDDCWTDINKLQKQVDFLEKNPEYGMIHSRANIIDRNNELLFISEKNQPSGDVFDYLIFKNSFIINCTVCYRKSIIDSLIKKAKAENITYLIDYYMWLYTALHSKIKYLDEVTSSYRSHSGGIIKKGNELHGNTIPYILTDIIFDRFLMSKKKNISLNKRYKYGFVYSKAFLSNGMKIRDKIKRLSFFFKQFYLIPAIFISFISKLYSFMKRIHQVKIII